MFKKVGTRLPEYLIEEIENFISNHNKIKTNQFNQYTKQRILVEGIEMFLEKEVNNLRNL